MSKVFKPSLVTSLIWVLGALLLAKTFWFLVAYKYLPKQSINKEQNSNLEALYYSVKLVKDAPVKLTQKPKPKVSDGLKGVKLLALYHASDMTIVTVSNKKKTKVLARGEKINGHELTGAGSNYAEFTKNNETKKVYLEVKKLQESTPSKSTPEPSLNVENNEDMAKKISSKYKPTGLGTIKRKGDLKVVPKAMVDYYMNNSQDIYKNMGIIENKSGDGLDGFKVTFVRNDSHFEELGLEKNDVIQGINGERLDSYEAAMAAYSKFKTGNSLTLTVKRNGEEQDFEFEVQ